MNKEALKDAAKVLFMPLKDVRIVWRGVFGWVPEVKKRVIEAGQHRAEKMEQRKKNDDNNVRWNFPF
ncbi:MAG TPA: hypothetical protein VJB96_00420 [Patescibacteria group bacterium]|nr:hypothetical protein [Patescibacteria group bacterium]